MFSNTLGLSVHDVATYTVYICMYTGVGYVAVQWYLLAEWHACNVKAPCDKRARQSMHVYNMEYIIVMYTVCHWDLLNDVAT